MIVNGTNISMIRGDSEGISVSVENSSGLPEPLLIGDTIYFTVKKSTRTEEKVLQKIITEFQDGVALITLDPVDTKHLQFGTYVYDIQLTRANGSVKTIIPPSTFTILGEVTYE